MARLKRVASFAHVQRKCDKRSTRKGHGVRADGPSRRGWPLRRVAGRAAFERTKTRGRRGGGRKNYENFRQGRLSELYYFRTRRVYGGGYARIQLSFIFAYAPYPPPPHKRPFDELYTSSPGRRWPTFSWHESTPRWNSARVGVRSPSPTIAPPPGRIKSDFDRRDQL